MSNTLDFLTNAEDRIQYALRSDSFLEAIDVLRNANGDLGDQITQALAGLGLFIVLRVHAGPVPLAGGIEPWDVEFVITENALLNRGEGSSGKTCRDVLQALIRVVRSTNVCDLTIAQEVVTDGYVVWQVKGKVEVTVPLAATES